MIKMGHLKEEITDGARNVEQKEQEHIRTFSTNKSLA
jgi:hypothetical protein